MDAEFLVVGGGLGGGVLAGLLAKAGRRILVLERNPGKTPLVRPEILWPATVEILASLLPEGALATSMVPVQAVHVLRGGAPLVRVAPEQPAEGNRRDRRRRQHPGRLRPVRPGVPVRGAG